MDEPELLQLITKCVAADVEQAGGMGLVSIGLCHGDVHQLTLNLFQRSAAFGNMQLWKAASIRKLLSDGTAIVSLGKLKCSEGRLLPRYRERQVLRIEFLSFFQNHGTLNCVL